MPYREGESQAAIFQVASACMDDVDKLGVRFVQPFIYTDVFEKRKGWIQPLM